MLVHLLLFCCGVLSLRKNEHMSFDLYISVKSANVCYNPGDAPVPRTRPSSPNLGAPRRWSSSGINIHIYMYMHIYIYIYIHGQAASSSGQFSWFQYANFKRGLKSQNHCLRSLQNTLCKLESPRGWARFFRLNFWKLAAFIAIVYGLSFVVLLILIL